MEVIKDPDVIPSLSLPDELCNTTDLILEAMGPI